METMTTQHAQIASDAHTMWTIDPSHSTIGFSVKHLMVATVHGRFNGFSGSLEFAGDRPVAVAAQIDAATIDTGIKLRDDDLRSANFFDVATYPTITFRSTRFQPVSSREPNRWLVAGDLTMHGVTRTVELAAEQTGAPERRDTNVLGFEVTGTINRKDFGMEFNLPIEGGGLVVGNDIKIAISVQANRIPIDAQ